MRCERTDTRSAADSSFDFSLQFHSTWVDPLACPLTVHASNLDPQRPSHLDTISSKSTMEAEHSARQARLAALRQQTKGVSSSAASTSSLHPFRRAISNVTTRRQRRQAQQQARDNADEGDEDEEDDEDAAPVVKSEKAMQRLAESTTEGQLLRRFRNWDPRTGEARRGDWTTVTGIEEGE